MNGIQIRKELVILVADKNMEFTMKGLLQRSQSFGIRQITYDCFPHLERDPGCLLRGHDFLRQFQSHYNYAIVMFDYKGCGKEQCSIDDLVIEVEDRLFRSGWSNRAAAIVINPELDAWIWSDSSNVDLILGWAGRNPDLRSWMFGKGMVESLSSKPRQPKEALEEALRIVGKPRSSSIYFKIAQLVSFERCIDQAFLKLKTTLSKWFSV